MWLHLKSCWQQKPIDHLWLFQASCHRLYAFKFIPPPLPPPQTPSLSLLMQWYLHERDNILQRTMPQKPHVLVFTSIYHCNDTTLFKKLNPRLSFYESTAWNHLFFSCIINQYSFNFFLAYFNNWYYIKELSSDYLLWHENPSCSVTSEHFDLVINCEQSVSMPRAFIVLKISNQYSKFKTIISTRISLVNVFPQS